MAITTETPAYPNPVFRRTPLIQFQGSPTLWSEVELITGKAAPRGPLTPAHTIDAIACGTLNSFICSYDRNENALAHIGLDFGDAPSDASSSPVEATAATPLPPITPSANLAIAIEAGPNPVWACQRIVYALMVQNLGPSPAVDTMLTDTVPNCVGCVYYSLNCGICWRPWTGSLSLGTLASGASVAICLSGVVRSCPMDGIVNTATVYSATYDPDILNNTATVTTRSLPLCGRGSSIVPDSFSLQSARRFLGSTSRPTSPTNRTAQNGTGTRCKRGSSGTACGR